MTGLKLAAVRAIAKRFDYNEIEHNEASRVVGYRGASGSVRINVYYTTGTIGTCLNHPTKGKTQLFRRNATLKELEQIFEDPRHHTGKGYYRKNPNQLWKTSENEFEWDSARRWRFVASATGLATTEKEIEAIAKCCTMWDDLVWERGDIPDLSFGNFHNCGARCALLSVVLEEANKMLGFACFTYRIPYSECLDGKQSLSDLNFFDEISCEHNMEEFLSQHSSDVLQFRSLLRSLKKDTRLELMLWFFQRDRQFILLDEDYHEFQTKYSCKVVSAHWEYGRMMLPKKTQMCKYCSAWHVRP